MTPAGEVEDNDMIAFGHRRNVKRRPASDSAKRKGEDRRQSFLRNGAGSLALLGILLATGLAAASLSAVVTADRLSRAQFRTLSVICENIAELQPEAEAAVLAAVREYSGSEDAAQDGPARVDAAVDAAARTDAYRADILARYGYRPADFAQPVRDVIAWAAVIGLCAGAALFVWAVIDRKRRQEARIRALAGYLEDVNLGSSGALLANQEDEFSRLQDEIYKTVTSLCQTREEALEAKRHFSENLYNIAHQLKTPLTAMSLSLQMMKKQREEENPGADIQPGGRDGQPVQDFAVWAAGAGCAPAGELEKLERQLSRLTRLEEALLLLSRAEAGLLPLKKTEIDVFTLLTMASDNLDELLRERHIFVDIPEAGESRITADMEWTMEALMNLLKNCAEHSPAGSRIHCDYSRNPIYTLIRVWDEGKGFAAKDIPHLFERFYRGEDASPDGIGIGLFLAKEIIEMQNGTIRAANRPAGGAEFEIRFYTA